MATYKISKSAITGPVLQTGTENLYYCKWKFKKTNTKEFSWEWQYTHNGSVWFSGGSGTTAYSDGAAAFTATYSPPENAKSIRFRVKPVAKEITKKKKKVAAYKGSMSAWVTTSKVNVYPETPSAPSVELLKNNILKITLETYDPLAKTIQFEVLEVRNNNPSIYKRAGTRVSNARAVLEIGVASGGSYRVRCRAFNGDWASLEWSQYSSDIYTTPPQIIGDILIQATTENSAKVTLPTIIDGAVKYAVQYTTDPDYFDKGGNVASVTTDEIIGRVFFVSGMSTSDGKMYYFRFAAINKENQQGPWSNIFSCIFGTKPSPPTTWQSASAAKIGESVVLYWLHNSQDGSIERDAILEIRNGDTIIKNSVISNPEWSSKDKKLKPTEYIFSTDIFDRDVSLTWAVKTRGILDEYSDFSVTRKIDIFYPPIVSLNIFKERRWFWDPLDFEEGTIYTCPAEYMIPYDLPVETIPHYPLYVGVDVTPKTIKPIELNLSVYSTMDYKTEDYKGEAIWIGAEEQIFSMNFGYVDFEETPNMFQLALQPSDISLADGITYRMAATVLMSSGLTGTDEVIFTVDFEEENHDVNAIIDYDPELACCYIQPYCEYMDQEKLVPGYLLSVYRKDFDGKFTEIANRLENEEQITVLDPHPTLRNVVYRIVAISKKTGSVLYYDLPPEPVDETAIVLQWNERWKSLEDTGEYDEEVEPAWTGNMLKLPYNVDVSDSSSLDVSLVEYIGRSHPVTYYGTQVGQSHSLSSAVPYNDQKTIEKLRALQRYLGDVYIREPSGVGYWASISVNFSITHLELSIPVTIEAKRVEGGV